MHKSEIKRIGNTPTLFIDGEPTVAMAYTTYFAERSCHSDFIDAGYRIFFVNVSFTTSPINSAATGFTPFHTGVFEDPALPDYSEFEGQVYKIIEECHDAVIIPRIYVSMPKWWTKSHPNDVILTPKGGYREILFSESFRNDAEKLLSELVGHIQHSDYAEHVGGWQICGGQTQEWFHHDLAGSIHPSVEAEYSKWVEESYGDVCAKLPEKSDFFDRDRSDEVSENAKRYSIFSNLGVAKSIDRFARILKEKTNYEQIVGTFYGYSFESCNTAVMGSHALRYLLDSENLDFFSSPNAYAQNRAFGIDWADMIPVDSVRLHGKLCFIECDIRTHLTVSIQEARPGEYPDDMYRTGDGASVWVGPPTAELSREALRKCFAHQITKGSAIWWFDMWGGWYDDPLLMDELISMKKIYDENLGKDKSSIPSEVIFFADERGYANMLSDSIQLSGISDTRTAMGNTGAPYDTFMSEDAEIVLKNYKAAIFPMPIPSEAGKRAMELCKTYGIPYLCATEEHYALTKDEILKFYKDNGIHIYSDDGDVIYSGNGYIGMHAAKGGVKRLSLPNEYSILSVFGTELKTHDANTVEFKLKEYETVLFEIYK